VSAEPVAAFVDGLRRQGTEPEVRDGLVVYRVEPVEGRHAGEPVETAVEVAELAGWPMVPPHWIHLPAGVTLPATNSQGVAPCRLAAPLAAGPRLGRRRRSRTCVGRPRPRRARGGPVSARTSVAMTAVTHDALARHLVRDDRQEDICLATYRPSTGSTRRTALVRQVILPEPGERAVHGNASITGEYVLRAAALAHEDGCGLVLAHSHPGGRGWQVMSREDRDAEAAYANLAREITGLPLVGMTLATADDAWSARHWDRGTGPDVQETDVENVRVLGDRLVVTWNDALVPPPPARRSQVRAVARGASGCSATSPGGRPSSWALARSGSTSRCGWPRRA
jgi:hypothetical protein